MIIDQMTFILPVCPLRMQSLSSFETVVLPFCLSWYLDYSKSEHFNPSGRSLHLPWGHLELREFVDQENTVTVRDFHALQPILDFSVCLEYLYAIATSLGNRIFCIIASQTHNSSDLVKWAY